MARYREIADDLRARIKSGQYPPGTRLPGYRDLLPMYGAGRDTVRRALGLLEQDGLIEGSQRRGIVVRHAGDRRRIRRGTAIMRDPRRGYVFPAAAAPDEPWKSHGTPRRSMDLIPEDLAQLLGVEPGSEVLRRRRVMSPADHDIPWDITDTWVHPAIVAEIPQVAEIDTGPGGVLDRIEEHGHGPLSWEERTRARMPSRDEARLLHMPRTGLPVLELVRIGRSARTGDPVEVTAVVIPGDRVEVWTTLTRHEAAQWPVSPVTPDV